MMGYGYDMGWFGMGAGLLVLVVVIVLVVWLIVRLTGPGARPGGPPADEAAEDLLRRRFAAGEIDAEEYQRRLGVLRSGR